MRAATGVYELCSPVSRKGAGSDADEGEQVHSGMPSLPPSLPVVRARRCRTVNSLSRGKGHRKAEQVLASSSLPSSSHILSMVPLCPIASVNCCVSETETSERLKDGDALVVSSSKKKRGAATSSALVQLESLSAPRKANVRKKAGKFGNCPGECFL